MIMLISSMILRGPAKQENNKYLFLLCFLILFLFYLPLDNAFTLPGRHKILGTHPGNCLKKTVLGNLQLVRMPVIPRLKNDVFVGNRLLIQQKIVPGSVRRREYLCLSSIHAGDQAAQSIQIYAFVTQRLTRFYDECVKAPTLGKTVTLRLRPFEGEITHLFRPMLHCYQVPKIIGASRILEWIAPQIDIEPCFDHMRDLLGLHMTKWMLATWLFVKLKRNRQNAGVQIRSGHFGP